MKKLFLFMLMIAQSLIVFGQAGSLDPSFNPGSGANGEIITLFLQNDGKILIGGDFTNFDDSNLNRIARINEDGSLDKTFDPGHGANSWVYSIKKQLDGKILLGGEFTLFDNIPANRIVRLNENGEIDQSFIFGLGFNDYVWSSLILPNGKIIIAGGFTSYNGIPTNYIVQLNSDGTIDPSFNIESGPNAAVFALTLQQDGKILIGGDFTQFNGEERNHIARLHSDGSLDISFEPGKGFNGQVDEIIQQPDGKILVSGFFSSFNDLNNNGIIRLNSDGSLDFSFDSGENSNGNIYSIELQSDGKIIIVGSFTSFNNQEKIRIARLNQNGSIDNSFFTGSGPNSLIEGISIQSDGKILISGSFTSYNEISKGRIARILNDLDPCQTNTSPEINTISGPESPLPLGSDALVEVDFSDKNISSITWKVFDGNSVIQEFTDEISGDKAIRTFQNLPVGVYSIQVELEDECGETTEGQYDYVVIFDPDGGFVTGGGWILSPDGAYVLDPSLTGRANFGFVAKYRRGKNNSHEVDGNTEFQFRAAGLNFKSSSHDDMSLVVANHKAIYKGKGSINGHGGYSFMVSAIDGSKLSNNESDRFRIKIWEESTQEVVYDNQMDAAENEDPSTILGGGSIVIYEAPRGNQNKRIEGIDEFAEKSTLTYEQESLSEPESNSIKIYPNPAIDNANIHVSLREPSTVEIRIFDSAGRLVFNEESVQEESFVLSIPMNALNNGLYHVVVKVNQQYLQGRLVKK